MNMVDQNDFSMFHEVIEIANKEFDGHFTLFKFTTGWKVVFCTPDMSQDDRETLNTACAGHCSLSEALKNAIKNKPAL